MKLNYQEIQLIRNYRKLSAQEQDDLYKIVNFWIDRANEKAEAKKSLGVIEISSILMTGRNDCSNHEMSYVVC